MYNLSSGNVGLNGADDCNCATRDEQGTATDCNTIHNLPECPQRAVHGPWTTPLGVI